MVGELPLAAGSAAFPGSAVLMGSDQVWRRSPVQSGDTVEERAVCVLLPESPALALPHPWEPWQAPEVGGEQEGVSRWEPWSLAQP